MMDRKNYRGAIHLIDYYRSQPRFSMDFLAYRFIIHFRFVCLHRLGRDAEFLEEIQKLNFEISEETLDVFKLEAIILARNGKFIEAYHVLDKIMKINPHPIKKAIILSTRGDILKMEKKFEEAISYYNQSLSIESKYLIYLTEFHKETVKGLKECQNLIRSSKNYEKELKY